MGAAPVPWDLEIEIVYSYKNPNLNILVFFKSSTLLNVFVTDKINIVI